MVTVAIIVAAVLYVIVAALLVLGLCACASYGDQQLAEDRERLNCSPEALSSDRAIRHLRRPDRRLA